jgi:hypothetical protein
MVNKIKEMPPHCSTRKISLLLFSFFCCSLLYSLSCIVSGGQEPSPHEVWVTPPSREFHLGKSRLLPSVTVLTSKFATLTTTLTPFPSFGGSYSCAAKGSEGRLDDIPLHRCFYQSHPTSIPRRFLAASDRVSLLHTVDSARPITAQFLSSFELANFPHARSYIL